MNEQCFFVCIQIVPYIQVIFSNLLFDADIFFNGVAMNCQEHKDELALGVGAAVVLGLGIAVDIPEAEVTHLGYFVLSCLIGPGEGKG